MRVAFHTYPKKWQSIRGLLALRRHGHRYWAGHALRRGVERCGLETITGRYDEPTDADVAVIWGWKQSKVISACQQGGQQLLVLERGFIQPRHAWISLTWNGLNGRGQFPTANDNGARWRQHFATRLQPWRTSPGDYVLLIGQVPGDAALHGACIETWLNETAKKLLDMGHRVRFRPHPLHRLPSPAGAEYSTSSLTEDLGRADRCVVYNSTTAVEAVLAGVPTVVCDIGAAAWPMASHDVAQELVRPDRAAWCHDLSWRQWRASELKDGGAWRFATREI